MAAGDFAGKVLRTTAGIMSEIDPKKTLKYTTREVRQSKAFKTGKGTANFLGGGVKNTIRNMGEAKGKQSFGTALKNAHMSPVRDAAGKIIKENGKVKMNYDAKKIAGTAIGVSMAGRVVTGGGLYKDSNGNFNIPGLPFI